MPRQKFEFQCTECHKIFDFNLNLALNGNYRIHCPNCKHIHYRVVENGKITDNRFPDRSDSILIEDICPMKASCQRDQWEDEWISFAHETLGVEFIVDEKVVDPLRLVDDTVLFEVFDRHWEFGERYDPVWERKNFISEYPEILEKFPFIYKYTVSHLIFPALEIIENRGTELSDRDFCVEFMSLYQMLMSIKEKFCWDCLLPIIYRLAKNYQEGDHSYPNMIHNFNHFFEMSGQNG